MSFVNYSVEVLESRLHQKLCVHINKMWANLLKIENKMKKKSFLLVHFFRRNHACVVIKISQLQKATWKAAGKLEVALPAYV